MRHLWPDKILLRFRFRGNQVSNLLVYVVLNSESKNNFTVGPLSTNDQGEIYLTAKQLKRHIENAKLEYPMDYVGKLEDCKGFDVTVDGKAELQQREKRLREFYPTEAMKLRKLSVESSNRDFNNFRKTWRLPINTDVIEIDLTRYICRVDGAVTDSGVSRVGDVEDGVEEV